MFNNLKSRLKNIFTNIGKKPSINAEDLKQVLREIRLALLEADVSLDLVKEITKGLETELLGKEIQKSISPKQIIMKSFYNLIEDLLGENEDVQLLQSGISYIMLVGLQGSGKTTTSVKLANYIYKNKTKKVLLVSLDFNRLAAYKQLQDLAKQNNFSFFEYEEKDTKAIIQGAQNYAKQHSYDVVIFDTAGRLHVDNELLKEIQQTYFLIKPKETLLVIDANVGQIALDVAKSFNEKISLTGIIASKSDSNAKGGAILSCRYITNVPIKFLGTGEKPADLEKFVAKKIVDRLLDQGDILSLVEQFNDIQDQEAKDLEKRLSKGIFTLNDFKKQITMMKKLGGASSLLGMLPGIGSLKANLQQINQAEKTLKKNVAIIDSMTKYERTKPEVLNFSRKQRIAKGSGTTLQDINILLRQFEQSQKMLKGLKKSGMLQTTKKEAKSLTTGVITKNGKLDMKSLMNFSKRIK